MAAVDVAIHLDGVVASVSSTLQVVPAAADLPHAVHVRATPEIVLALVEGRVPIHDAIRSGAIEIFGDVTALRRGRDTLDIYLHGLVRCPSAPTLLAALQDHVGEQEINDEVRQPSSS